MKPKTIEEAGIEYSKLIPYVNDLITDNSRLDFIAGAKWQQEQDLITHEFKKDDNVFKSLRKVYEHLLSLRYSEKEVLDLITKYIEDNLDPQTHGTIENVKEWFEPLKKT